MKHFKSLLSFTFIGLASLVSHQAQAAIDCASLKAPLSENEDLDYTKLAKFVQCNGFTRIDQVLKNLPSRLRSNYMLVYESHSRHRDATVDEPRIILEDKYAKIIIASAGNPTQINGDNLEIIENPEDGTDSKFHVIVFPEKSSGPVRYSETNPALCTTCHRAHLSPNWQSYPAWPGVYGSGDESGTSEDDHFKTFIGKLQKEKLVNPKDPTLNRYEALTDLINGKTDVSDLAFRNQVFAADIGQFNQRRLLKVMNESPYFESLEPAMTAAAKACPQLTSFFPPQLQQKFKMSLSAYRNYVQKDTFDHFDNEIKTIAQLTDGYYQRPEDWLFFFAVKPFIAEGYIMKYIMGIDPDDYSVTLGSSVYNSHETIGGMENQFLYSYGTSGSDDSCAALKTESLKRLQNIQ